MVEQKRLELSTLTLPVWCSSQLSYCPVMMLYNVTPEIVFSSCFWQKIQLFLKKYRFLTNFYPKMPFFLSDDSKESSLKADAWTDKVRTDNGRKQTKNNRNRHGRRFRSDKWSTAAPYEAYFVLASFARQASKYMKRTFGAWSETWRFHVFALKSRQKNGANNRNRQGGLQPDEEPERSEGNRP